MENVKAISPVKPAADVGSTLNKLTETLKQQEARVASVARDIAAASSRGEAYVDARNAGADKAPVKTDDFAPARLQSETFLAAAGTEEGTDGVGENPGLDLIASQVELLEAKNSFKAVAQAIEVVNEVNDQLLDILR